MVYESLFNKIMKVDPTFEKTFRFQEYEGNLESVLDETLEALSSKKKIKDIIHLALHPPRIIRAILDYKIENPNSLELESLLKDAINIGLDIYRNNDTDISIQEIYEFIYKINETKNEPLLYRELKQPSDFMTWNATNPIRSESSANKLITKTKGEPVLFLALAHGGIAAGMDTYLRYCNKSENKNSFFYTARYSTRKSKDIDLHLNPSEILYLQEQLQEKQIVLFDEDKTSGKTLENAHNFLYENVFQKKNIILLTNLDKKEEMIRYGYESLFIKICMQEYNHRKKHEIV